MGLAGASILAPEPLMLVLVSKGLPSIQRHGGPNLGRLVQPRNWNVLDATDRALPWAADNDAYSGFDEPRYWKMVEAIAQRRRHLLLFVTAPDVVGDATETLRLFRVWAPRLRALGLPVGYVLQDGATVETVPWDEVDCVFVGGTTEFKLSETASTIVHAAQNRDVWCHMGRVNTRKRIQYAKSIGIDSVDGASSVLFTDTHLPWQKRHAAGPTQGRLIP